MATGQHASDLTDGLRRAVLIETRRCTFLQSIQRRVCNFAVELRHGRLVSIGNIPQFARTKRDPIVEQVSVPRVEMRLGVGRVERRTAARVSGIDGSIDRLGTRDGALRVALTRPVHQAGA